MIAKSISPILNVSDLAASFDWFARLGWSKGFDWGSPPDFGCVRSGDCEIFLCVDGQGGRGRSHLPHTDGEDGEGADKGVWMSIWVDDVDAVHALALAQGIEVTCLPEDQPWGVREMHLRHPDGHVFRISASLPCTD